MDLFASHHSAQHCNGNIKLRHWAVPAVTQLCGKGSTHIKQEASGIDMEGNPALRSRPTFAAELTEDFCI